MAILNVLSVNIKNEEESDDDDDDDDITAAAVRACTTDQDQMFALLETALRGYITSSIEPATFLERARYFFWGGG